MEFSFTNKLGHTQNFWAVGTMVFGLTVVIANIKIFIISFDHSIASIWSNLIFSNGLYFGTLIIFSNWKSTELYQILYP